MPLKVFLLVSMMLLTGCGIFQKDGNLDGFCLGIMPAARVHATHLAEELPPKSMISGVAVLNGLKEGCNGSGL